PAVNSSSGRSGLGLGKLIGLGVVVGVLLIGALLLLLRPSPPSPDADIKHPGVPMSEDAAKKQLEDARGKLNEKDYEGAHKKLRAIPENSPVYEDPEFKKIEEEWADWMFRKVEETADNNEKKRLLKEINTTPSVDAERRKKAADRIADIEAKEPPPPAPA